MILINDMVIDTCMPVAAGQVGDDCPKQYMHGQDIRCAD